MAAKPMNPASRIFRELSPAQIAKRERAAAQPPPPKRPRPQKQAKPVEIIR
jgi:hypothetical protein